VVVLAVAGAVAIAPVISGCGAGETPQSAYPTRLSEGVNVTVPKDRPEASQIDLRNMFLLGAKPGEPIKPGQAMPLYGVLINQVEGRQDRLVAVSSPAFGGAKIAGGAITLPPAAPDGAGSMVSLLGKPSAQSPPAAPTSSPTGTGSPEPTAGTGATPNPSSTPTSQNTAGSAESPQPANSGTGEEPLIVLNGLTQELVAGSTVPVRLQFEHAGTVEFQVPVVPHQQDYLTYPAAPSAPAGPTPGSTTSPTGSPSPGATGEPTPGATRTPGGTATPAA
jgi:hypothetical protein